MKCRSIDGTAYLIVSEKAAASGPLYVGFVPKEGAAVGENGNAVVSDKFCASVSSEFLVCRVAKYIQGMIGALCQIGDCVQQCTI